MVVCDESLNPIGHKLRIDDVCDDERGSPEDCDLHLQQRLAN